MVGLSDDEIEVDVDVELPRTPLPVPGGSQVRREISTDEEEDSDFIGDGDGWSHSWLLAKPSPPTRKKPRSSGWGSAGGFIGRVITENDQEVMVLSE